MSDLPAPLVPSEVDLRDFREMPLEFERLFASDTWVLGNPEEKVASFHLWCKSWHQVPAGSLPDDDRMLAHLSNTALRWKKLRVHALRGWVMCADGRFYHPVVAEKAVRAWAAKLDRRSRTHNARIASLRKKFESVTGPERDLLQAQLAVLLQAMPEPVTGSKGSEGKGREEKGIVKAKPSAAPRRPARDQAPTAEVWAAYSAAYEKRYSVAPLRNAKVNGQLASLLTRVPIAEAPDIAAFYVESNKGLYVSARHCVDLLLRDAEGLRTEWITGRRVTETGARQADRTASRGEVFNDLIEEAREKTA